MADPEYGNPGAYDADVETVRSIYAAFARQDLDGALDHLAPDCEFFPYGTAARVGRSEPYRGHAGVREYFADAARVWDDLRIYADDVRAAGNSVIAFGHVEARVRGEEVRTRAVWVWRLRDGKAISMRVHDVGNATPS